MSDRDLPADAPADDLVELYRDGHARLERLVTEALERGAQGTATWRRRQLAEVGRILADLERRTPAAARLAATAPYNAAATAVDGVIGGTAVAFGGVHEQAVAVLAENMSQRLGLARATVGRRADDAFRKAALKETALGLVEGSTRPEVSDRLRARLVREGVTDATTGFVDKAGRRWGLERYTRMVAMTTTREAQTAATANRLVERGQDLVTISSHRTETPLCKRYEGKTFSLTGRTAGYPVIDVLPPFHPGCWHVVTPAAANFDQWEAALRAAA